MSLASLLVAAGGAGSGRLGDVGALWRYPFMRHAVVAGTAVAVMCGVVGWFAVLRREAYAAHSLAMVAFPGATTAAFLGLAPVVGYLGGGVAGAVAIAWLGRGNEGRAGHRHSAAVGSVQAAALALGLLVASRYRGFLTDVTAFLFGSFLGVTSAQAVALVALAVVSVAGVVAAGRPLLFATVEPAVAAGSGVPTGALSGGFLVLVAVAVAGASQFTGVLLVFSLLVAPAAAAQALTARPAASLGLAVALAVASTWVGVWAAFVTDRPVGFWITGIGFVTYLGARATRAAVDRAGRGGRA
ncbi:MAG: metal ABC transporter permease [Acidimicrobiales bacterium]